MSHPELDLLWELSQGALAEDAAAPLREHLASCADCRQRLQETSRARAISRQLAVPLLAPERWVALGERIQAAARDELAPRTKRSPWWWVLLPAGMVLGGMGVFQALAPVVPPKEAVPAPVEPARVVAHVLEARDVRVSGHALEAGAVLGADAAIWVGPVGAMRVALVDGSVARLLPSTRASVRHSGEWQLERGGVRVDAAASPTPRLGVRAGEVDVFVVGTRFLVQRDERKVLIAVSEGAVQVRSSGHEQSVSAGRELSVQDGQDEQRPLSRPSREVLEVASAPPAKKRPAVATKAVPAVADAGIADAEEPEVARQPLVPPLTRPPEEAPPRGPIGLGAALQNLGLAAGDLARGVLDRVQQGAEQQVEAGADHLRQWSDRLLRLDHGGAPDATHRAKEIERLADDGHCDQVPALVEAWLSVYPNPSELRDQVEAARSRCAP